MEPREQRAVLDLLDVLVTVTGWRPCEACGGKGEVRGGPGGLPCGSCRATRRTPSLRMEGLVLDSRIEGLRTAARASDLPARSHQVDRARKARDGLRFGFEAIAAEPRGPGDRSLARATAR